MNKIVPSNSEILRLYKHLMRYSKQLQLSDKSYFQERVRKEFRANCNETNPENINCCFKRGEALLRRGRIL